MDGVALSAAIFGAASLVAFIIEGNSTYNDAVERLRRKRLTVSPVIISQLSNPDHRSAKISLNLVEPILTTWIKKNVLSMAVTFKTIVVPTTIAVAAFIGIAYALKDKYPLGDDLVNYLQILLYSCGSASVVLVALIKRLTATWGK